MSCWLSSFSRGAEEKGSMFAEIGRKGNHVVAKQKCGRRKTEDEMKSIRRL